MNLSISAGKFAPLEENTSSIRSGTEAQASKKGDITGFLQWMRKPPEQPDDDFDVEAIEAKFDAMEKAQMKRMEFRPDDMSISLPTVESSSSQSAKSATSGPYPEPSVAVAGDVSRSELCTDPRTEEHTQHETGKQTRQVKSFFESYMLKKRSSLEKTVEKSILSPVSERTLGALNSIKSFPDAKKGEDNPSHQRFGGESTTEHGVLLNTKGVSPRQISEYSKSQVNGNEHNSSDELHDNIYNVLESSGTVPDPVADTSDYINCEKCGERVLAWDLPEHLDFHFAMDLQNSCQASRSLPLGGSVAPSSLGGARGSVKRKSEASSRGRPPKRASLKGFPSNTQKLQQYFKKI